MTVDQAKLDKFMEKAVLDIGATASAALVILGDKLGIYKALADAGPSTPSELSLRTGTSERYIREWLANQAAGGYIMYDLTGKKYFMTQEQVYALAKDDSPVFLPGAFQVMASIIKDEPKIRKAFVTGKGVDWGEHDPGLFEGTERFFKPNYLANLIPSWIPSLDGVETKLKSGAIVADVGCGHGSSTILMAKTYPNSTFVGFDYHRPSIEWAQREAQKAGLGNRIKFEIALSTDFPGKDYDLVTFFDCLHDMGDPVGAMVHTKQSLKKDGTLLLVEPFANDKLEDNMNPLGRIFYAASTMVCVPASLAHNGPALGAQAGEKRLKDVLTAGGFTRFRRATQPPFNLILEARP
jgi:SAM-dependent methyltransferase